jgi:hypothetical protein
MKKFPADFRERDVLVPRMRFSYCSGVVSFIYSGLTSNVSNVPADVKAALSLASPPLRTSLPDILLLLLLLPFR